jgi:hypothetical protein
MKSVNIPGFTADSSLYRSGIHYCMGDTTINATSARELHLVQPAAYGCSPCILYTEPGPGGRSAGIRTCCSLTCRTTIFGTYRCYEYCTGEVCATFPAGEIIV